MQGICFIMTDYDQIERARKLLDHLVKLRFGRSIDRKVPEEYGFDLIPPEPKPRLEPKYHIDGTASAFLIRNFSKADGDIPKRFTVKLAEHQLTFDFSSDECTRVWATKYRDRSGGPKANPTMAVSYSSGFNGGFS